VTNQPAAVRQLSSSRQDAVRNYHRVLAAAREVLAESGVDASMEEIAGRAGVGVGTVYRRFASKDALLDELGRMMLAQVLIATDAALTRTDGSGLEYLLSAIGQSFTDHGRYAFLLLERRTDDAATRRIRSAIKELTARAAAAGTVDPETTMGDVMALIWSMRGLVQVVHEVAPNAWQRHLDIHLAGLRADGPRTSSPALTSRQLAKLMPRARS
jgi:AcrR family transcriptional regulator